MPLECICPSVSVRTVGLIYTDMKSARNIFLNHGPAFMIQPRCNNGLGELHKFLPGRERKSLRLDLLIVQCLQLWRLDSELR